VCEIIDTAQPARAIVDALVVSIECVCVCPQRVLARVTPQNARRHSAVDARGQGTRQRLKFLRGKRPIGLLTVLFTVASAAARPPLQLLPLLLLFLAMPR